MRCILIVCLLWLGVGCDEAKEAARKADKALDSSQVDALKDKAKAVKANLEAGRDSLSDCASGLALEVGDAADAKEAYEALKTLCRRDVPLAKANRIVADAEKARAERPAENPLQECFHDDWDPTTVKLDKELGGDAAWAALKARWAKVCPPMP